MLRGNDPPETVSHVELVDDVDVKICLLRPSPLYVYDVPLAGVALQERAVGPMPQSSPSAFQEYLVEAPATPAL